MLRLLKHQLPPRVLFTLLIELVALNIGLMSLLFVRLARGTDHHLSFLMPLFALTGSLVIQFGLWSFGLYSRSVVYSGIRVFKKLAGAFVLLCVLLFPVCYLFSLSGVPVFEVTLKFYVLLLAVFILVVALERYVVLRAFSGTAYLGNLLVLGAEECTLHVIREARKHHGTTLRLMGILAESPEQIGQLIEGVPIIGTFAHLRETVEEMQVKTIILSLPYEHPQLPLDFLVEFKLSGNNVYDAYVFYETVGQKILLEKLNPFAMLFPQGYDMPRLTRFFKDCLERLFALLMLGVLLIPMAAVGIAIRLTSPGPAIFRQKRFGKGGKVFTLYKFRTMRDGAEKGTGAVWCQKGDPRITWVGKWLRKTRIDELPQLLNVLKGDMAFVGPRPERPEFVEELRKKIPFYHHRHFVKPGITGWAQVSFPYAATLEDSEEKLRYDLYYVKNMSIFFDLIIILATIRTVIRGGGSAG
jgi:exopolysaccharide biosynthesis polyprenyl glycosylphosphotransferase